MHPTYAKKPNRKIALPFRHHVIHTKRTSPGVLVGIPEGVSMRTETIIFFCFLIPRLAQAQNLVPNPGFEEMTQLPADYGQWHFCKDWNNVGGNISGPPFGSPDYFHTQGTTGDFFGQIKPNTGDAQMGFTTYHPGMYEFREYIATKLREPMGAGLTYQVSFFITNGTGTGGYPGASNNIGIHFSKAPLHQEVDEPIPVEPQIEITQTVFSTSWVQYTFSLTATDDFECMTIGNFRMDTETENSGDAAYYFIDDVVVTLINL